MGWMHPAAIAHQRQRWLRPDAARWLPPAVVRLFAPLDKPEAKRASPQLSADEFDRELESIRPDYLELKALHAVRKFERTWAAFRSKAYSPDQPRVSAGNPDGGQWTYADGTPSRGSRDARPQTTGSRDARRNDPRVLSDATPDNPWKPGARYAGGYPADLRDNAHVLAEHVKSPNYVVSRVRDMAERARRLGDRFQDLSTAGSFSSLESANKLASSTLAQNESIVDQVANGALPREAIEARFGSPTGYEGYMRSERSQAELRETYGVRVVIVHDPSTSKGYKIITAFPIR